MVELTLVDALLILALLVIVPVGLSLVPGYAARTAGWTVAAALPAAAALLVSRGVAAAALAVPWLLYAAAAALVVLGRWWAGGRRLDQLVWVAATGYLAFGALWLVADRADLEPAGFAPPLVQLTAVHFHYAGFASSLLVACAGRRFPRDRVAGAAVAATVAAPPLVAVGFAFLGVLQILGAALLAAGLLMLAWVTGRRVVPAVDRLSAGLLAVSALSVVVPMLLAVQWAVGANLGTPALSIDDMARTHGVLNAVGFALAGVLGWRRIRAAG